MMLYVWQLNCLVMFILDFGPWVLMTVQMKGHVLHFSWLQRVVPGVLVAALANTSSCVGLQNKIGHPARCRFLFSASGL